jgi:hypothetical protein
MLRSCSSRSCTVAQVRAKEKNRCRHSFDLAWVLCLSLSLSCWDSGGARARPKSMLLLVHSRALTRERGAVFHVSHCRLRSMDIGQQHGAAAWHSL